MERGEFCPSIRTYYSQNAANYFRGRAKIEYDHNQRPCSAVRGVSKMTTQGDLVLLEKEGKVEAVHGMW